VEEVKAGKAILQSLAPPRRDRRVACPTCGRVEGDVISIATQVEEVLANEGTDPVAVMGCLRQRSGEAREADVGLALSGHGGTIFRRTAHP